MPRDNTPNLKCHSDLLQSWGSWPVSPPSLAHLPNQTRSALVPASPDGLQRLSALAAAHRPLHGSVATAEAPKRSGPCTTQSQAVRQNGRAHVCTPVTNAQLVCRLLL